MAKELSAGPNGTFHTCRGGSCVQLVRMVSVEMPSWFGPRYCGQSAAHRALAAKTISGDRSKLQLRGRLVWSRAFMLVNGLVPPNVIVSDGKRAKQTFLAFSTLISFLLILPSQYSNLDWLTCGIEQTQCHRLRQPVRPVPTANVCWLSQTILN